MDAETVFVAQAEVALHQRTAYYTNKSQLSHLDCTSIDRCYDPCLCKRVSHIFGTPNVDHTCQHGQRIILGWLDQ